MRTPRELSDEFVQAYAYQTEMLRQLAEADALLSNAQASLTNARAALILKTDAKTLGANEAQREAALLDKTFIEREQVLLLEAKRNGLRYLLDSARLRLDAAKTELRLLELEARSFPLPDLPLTLERAA